MVDHPQSQGIIERVNGILETKIARWMETHRQTNWTSVLGRIVYTMNCEISRTTKFSPYELVFGVSPQKDRVLLDELFESGVTEEILAQDSADIEAMMKSKMKVGIVTYAIISGNIN